ncbi:unnamed protein product, partial [Cuscuta epithymum]
MKRCSTGAYSIMKIKMKVEVTKRMMQMNMKLGVEDSQSPPQFSTQGVSFDQPPPQFSTHQGVSFDQPPPYYDSYQCSTQVGDYVESFLNSSFYYGDTTGPWNTGGGDGAG